MSDNQNTVKSKISMDLKNRNKVSSESDLSANPNIDTSSAVQKDTSTVTSDQGQLKEPVITRTPDHIEKAPEPKNAVKSSVSKSSSSKENAARRSASIPFKHYDDEYKKKRLMGIILLLILVLFAIAMALALRYESVGHYYYVESTIAPPSTVETKTNALVLGSCVIDFTMQATPSELTELVQDEYNYEGNSDDYVQTLVRTGCDKDASLPIIHHGNAFAAMF